MRFGKKKKRGLNDFYKIFAEGKKTRFYISSEETFFIEEALRYAKLKIFPSGDTDFNFDLFYGRETAIDRVADTIETLPMMAQNRLVVLRKADELGESDWSLLQPTLEDPCPGSVVLFIGKKPDSRKKYVKAFVKHLEAFDFPTPYDNEVPGWIRYIAKKHQIDITPEAISLCQQVIGAQLRELENEIVKMSLFEGPDKPITDQTVLEVASRVKMQNIFDLTKAIGTRDRARSLECLGHLLENGQSEIGILAMVQRHIRLLRQVRLGESKGYRGKELSSYAGVPHFFLNEYRSQSQLWSEDKIEETFHYLLQTDRDLKSSAVSQSIWLENFILKCS